LTNLKELSLDSNQITEIKNLETLINLTKLILSENKILKISNLKHLKYLQFLYLNKNYIENTELIWEIPFLAELEFSDNHITEFDTRLIKGRNILRLYLADNEFANIPSEITNLDNCVSDARAWFNDLERESAENYEVKLMLVGNGRVGKTSMLRRLLQGQFDPEENSTHGIQLYDYQVATDFLEQPLRIHAWDFGGQEIYHATHRLFMQSRALYMVLWDWETEKTPFAAEYIAGELVRFRNYELTYWLDHARSLSWKSPLLVIQNKMDQHGRQWPKHLNELQERYNVINFFQVSAATGENISVLKSAMLEAFRKMPEVGMKTPAQWLRVKEKVLSLKNDHKTIDFSTYQSICEEENLNVSSTQALIRFLHNTGNLFYQAHLFQNQIILDQEWALEGLYALFQRGPFYKQLKFAGGRTSLAALAWPWQNYDLNTRKIFLSMMESCEICFQVTEDERDPEYILTEFLPDKKDEKVSSFWEKVAENELFLKYQTDFFHPAFISRFIARAGRLAKGYDHIWRNGIWITYHNAHALIEAFPDDHQIIIRVKDGPAKILLYHIHNAFKEIFYKPDSVEMDVSLSGQEYLRYQEVKDGKIKGMEKVLSNSRKMVDLEEVEFFSDVLDARSEDEVKQKLADIVPKPRLKKADAIFGIDGNFPEELLKKLKVKLKTEVAKDLERALEKADPLLLDGDLKNQLVTLQGNYADLKKFNTTSRLSFEEYNRNSSQIRSGLLMIIDGLTKEGVDVERVLGYLEG
ncbi:MAG TPA: COR domain-containing protein, partial [Flavilitoribacter sp.]|nr:COR domain-containing protein [Flavilitoribacter sp.]